MLYPNNLFKGFRASIYLLSINNGNIRTVLRPYRVYCTQCNRVQ
jgi:hypothetical protein